MICTATVRRCTDFTARVICACSSRSEALRREVEEAIALVASSPLSSRGACFSSVTRTGQEEIEIAEWGPGLLAGHTLEYYCTPENLFRMSPLIRRHMRNTCLRCGCEGHWAAKCTEPEFISVGPTEVAQAAREVPPPPPTAKAAHKVASKTATKAAPKATPNAPTAAPPPAAAPVPAPRAPHRWGRRVANPLQGHQPARLAPREFGVCFRAASTRQRLPCWRWQSTRDAKWRQVTLDGPTVVYPADTGSGVIRVKRLRCASPGVAEEVGGLIAEELAGAEPGAKRRRRYVFEPVIPVD